MLPRPLLLLPAPLLPTDDNEGDEDPPAAAASAAASAAIAVAACGVRSGDGGAVEGREGGQMRPVGVAGARSLRKGDVVASGLVVVMVAWLASTAVMACCAARHSLPHGGCICREDGEAGKALKKLKLELELLELETAVVAGVTGGVGAGEAKGHVVLEVGEAPENERRGLGPPTRWEVGEEENEEVVVVVVTAAAGSR